MPGPRVHDAEPYSYAPSSQRLPGFEWLFTQRRVYGTAGQRNLRLPEPLLFVFQSLALSYTLPVFIHQLSLKPRLQHLGPVKAALSKIPVDTDKTGYLAGFNRTRVLRFA